MWKYNRQSKKWYKQTDSLDIDRFNFEKQELEKIRYYSKCLNGSSYISINNFDDIYESLNHFEKGNNYFVDSPYNTSTATQSNPIDSSTRLDYNKYIDEYGFTIKNLFTPDRLIKDAIKNFVEVDVATTELVDLSVVNKNLVIDGIRLKNGHRVLVKDQTYTITLSDSVDPETYFIGNYQIVSKDTTTVTYIYFNELNGIYTFNNGLLSRTTEIDDYSTSIRYSVGVKLGTSNRDKEYHLSRLKSGFFPTISSNEPIEFVDKHNYILRHKVEYQNIFELRYRSGVSTVQYTLLNANITIPERMVFVGQFGVILNYQDGYLNIINNKYKEELYSITHTSEYYWICGDNGTLLKMSTYDFSISNIDLGITHKLKDIKFFDDIHGFIVGDFNTIYWTNNGGFDWKKIEIDEFKDFNYNKVIIPKLNNVFIGGSNGFLAELILDNNEWDINKINPYKYLDYDDEYKLVDNINDIIYIDNLSTWNLGYINATYSVSTTKETLFIVGDNGLILFYDINNFTTQWDSVWLEPNDVLGNIKSANYIGNRFILNSDTSIWELYPNSFTAISATSNYISGGITNTGQDFYDRDISVNQLVMNNASRLFLIGNDSYLKSMPLSATLSFINATGSYISYDLDATYDDDKQSKLLFLDYDMASKLNFYDNNNVYRLPSTIELLNTVTQSGTVSNYFDSLIISEITNEKNWLTYFKDINKEFSYNSANFTNANKVQFSTTFTGLSYTSSTTVTSITNNLVDIGRLLPTYYYSSAPGATATNPPGSASYSLYLYNDMMILQSTQSATVGDIFKLDSDVITDTFMLNKIQTFSGSTYHYFYTNFNQNIITNLVNTTGSVVLSNLNRYYIDPYNTNYNNLVSNFSDHMIKYGYNLTYTTESNIYGFYDETLTLSPIYNNRTAYYNLESKVDYNYTGFNTVFNMTFTGTDGDTIFLDDNQHDVILHGGATISTATYSSSPTSGSFDGSTGYLTVTYSNVFDLSGVNFEINISFNLNTFAVPQMIFSSEDGVTMEESWGIIVQDTTNIFFFANDYGDNLNAIVPTMNINQWYKVTVRRTNGIIQLYVDNILYDSNTFTIGNTSTDLIYIGYSPVLALYTNGYLDDISLSVSGLTSLQMRYKNSFLDFGYTPTYNLYSYLNNIDPIFDVNKQFYSMPTLFNVPFGNNDVTISGNTNGYYLIVFSQSRVEEWTSFWNNTYIDFTIHSFKDIRTEKLLIRDKYIDETGYYILKLDNPIDTTGMTYITSFDIVSRNYLYQISSDLQELNNIQVSEKLKVYGTNVYSTLESELKSKFYTDSYARILLSDNDIKSTLTGIVYYDYKNELSMNIFKIEEERVLSISTTYNLANYLGITTLEKHELHYGDQVFIEFSGGDQTSSTYLNPHYNGISTVIGIIDDYNFYVNIFFGTPTSLYDPGVVKFSIYDPYINYEPIDIFDVGIDKNWKQSIIVKPNNHEITNKVHSLINIDFKKYRFTLIDGLTLPDLVAKYSWILEAEIEDAVIGLDSNSNIVWYKGIWNCGRWFGGTWYSGTWRSGTWYGGTWYSIQVITNAISAKLSLITSDPIFSTWLDGKWMDGTWTSGTWYGGDWYGGTWTDGIWNKGTWHDGLWLDGSFRGGTWITGLWKNGDFSCDYDVANWIDGAWNGGDFANGNWYNGKFDKLKSNMSRFGTRATNWRKAIWYSGEWSSGEFHSYLNEVNGVASESDSNRNSIWYTGLWNDGTWYGGIAYNMDFRSGTWYNGVLNNIVIRNYYPYDNKVQLQGEFNFNRLSNFWIIDNFSNSTWSGLGSNAIPTKYVVRDVIVDNGLTDVYFYESLTASGIFTTSSNYTGLSCVSSMANCQWYNGVWYNGIFDGDYFNSGQWYNGVFKKGIWLR